MLGDYFSLVSWLTRRRGDDRVMGLIGSEFERGAAGAGRFLDLGHWIDIMGGDRNISLRCHVSGGLRIIYVDLFNYRGDGLLFEGGVLTVFQVAYLYLGRSHAVL